jgi:hypothetical protein
VKDIILQKGIGDGKVSLSNSIDRVMNKRRAMNRWNPKPKKGVETFMIVY